MTFEETADLMRQAERLHGRLSDADREEYAAMIGDSTLPKSAWETFLKPIPVDIKERYLKMLDILFQSKLIDAETVEGEKAIMREMSPAHLARNGEFLMNWYRAEKEVDFPSRIR